MILNRFVVEDIQMIFLYYLNHKIISHNFKINEKMSSQHEVLFYQKGQENYNSLYVEVSRERGKFVNAVHQEPNFSCVYTYFYCFSIHMQIQYDLIELLRCFSIWSFLANNEFLFLKEIPKCFKCFLNKETLDFNC